MSSSAHRSDETVAMARAPRSAHFRSKILSQLIKSNEEKDEVTPERAIALLQHLFPSSTLMPVVCQDLLQFMFKESVMRVEESQNNHNHSHHRFRHQRPYKPIRTARIPLKDLYMGLVQDVTEKQRLIKDIQLHLEHHTKTSEALQLQIESIRAEIASHDNKKYHSDMRLLQHRRELREANLADHFQSLVEKEKALTELRKRCKEENVCLRNEERAFRSDIKMMNELEMQMSAQYDSATKEGRKKIRAKAETSNPEI